MTQSSPEESLLRRKGPYSPQEILSEVTGTLWTEQAFQGNPGLPIRELYGAAALCFARYRERSCDAELGRGADPPDVSIEFDGLKAEWEVVVALESDRKPRAEALEVHEFTRKLTCCSQREAEILLSQAIREVDRSPESIQVRISDLKDSTRRQAARKGQKYCGRAAFGLLIMLNWDGETWGTLGSTIWNDLFGPEFRDPVGFFPDIWMVSTNSVWFKAWCFRESGVWLGEPTFFPEFFPGQH